MSRRLAVLAACARVPADELEQSVWRVLARPGSWQTCAGSSAGSGPDFLPALNRQRDNDQPGQAPSAGRPQGGQGTADFIKAIRTGTPQPGVDVLANLPDGGVVTSDNVDTFLPLAEWPG